MGKWYDCSDEAVKQWLEEQDLSYEEIITWDEARPIWNGPDKFVQEDWIDKAMEWKTLQSFMDRNCST